MVIVLNDYWVAHRIQIGCKLGCMILTELRLVRVDYFWTIPGRLW